MMGQLFQVCVKKKMIVLNLLILYVPLDHTTNKFMNDLFVWCLKVDALVCNKAYIAKFVVVEVSLYV